ncbi:MAG: ABC transporter permease [Propionibacteriaceae bacterium]|jgi:ABC-2 type transport system permease protein|nr:ABC transporter permease [Propionibacteriaceae bacterium]
MSVIGSVISFEVLRTLKKPGFWISTLGTPLIIGAAGLISAMANMSAMADSGVEENTIVFEYTDASGLIDPAQATALKGTAITDLGQGLADVKAGTVDAYFYYPPDPSTQPVQVSGVDAGVFESFAYSDLATSLLQDSVKTKLADPQAVTLLVNGPMTVTTTYLDGEATAGFGEVIAPLLYAVIFFLLVVMLGNQMLAAFLEEKENRVAEMILTTISARKLLVGKLLSLAVAGVIQILVFMIPTVIMVTIWNSSQGGWLTLVFDPARMAVGLLILLAAFFLYMISVVIVGMIMPTQKEAGNLFAPILLITIMPLYAVMLMISSPDNPFVQFLTYFPWSGGVTSLVRNAFGSLSLWESALVIAVQFGVGLAVLALAARIAQYGLISYSKAINPFIHLKS